jgi:hypothetical protein
LTLTTKTGNIEKEFQKEFFTLAKLKTIIYIIEQPIKPSKKCDQEN